MAAHRVVGSTPLAPRPLIGRLRARGASHLLRVVLACLGVTLVGGCHDPYGQTVPPDVQPFSPTVIGVIARHDDPPGTQVASYTLVGGGRVELTPTTRTVFGGRSSSGDLMAAGTDGTGPWVAFAAHVTDSTPDCFRADGIVLDDGDSIVFGGYRFRKAPDFTTSWPSTKRGTRYPFGYPCFDAQFQVVSVGGQ